MKPLAALLRNPINPKKGKDLKLQQDTTKPGWMKPSRSLHQIPKHHKGLRV